MQCNKSQNIKFKAPGHRITNALYNYVRDLLADGLTNKMVSMLTGLGQNTVKDIDKERLREHYTIKTKDGLMLRKPENRPGFWALTNSCCTTATGMPLTSPTWRPAMFCGFSRARRSRLSMTS